MRGIDRVEFFCKKSSRSKGRRFKVRSKRFRGDLKTNFFTQRVVIIRNALKNVVDAVTFTAFKNHLINHMNCYGIMSSRPSTGKWD